MNRSALYLIPMTALCTLYATKVSDLNSDVASINEDLKDMVKIIEKIKPEVFTIGDDVSELRSLTSKIKTDVQTAQQGVSAMQQDLDAIQQDADALMDLLATQTQML